MFGVQKILDIWKKFCQIFGVISSFLYENGLLRQIRQPYLNRVHNKGKLPLWCICGSDARGFESAWNAKLRSKLTERASFCLIYELYSPTYCYIRAHSSWSQWSPKIKLVEHLDECLAGIHKFFLKNPISTFWRGQRSNIWCIKQLLKLFRMKPYNIPCESPFFKL